MRKRHNADRHHSQPRRIAFITGTRAEFGLMRTTLRAIADHPRLTLQIIATGMHLDRRHGDGLAAIAAAGFSCDAIVPWKTTGADATILAEATGTAMAAIARELDRLRADVVLVVGDRVEAFAGAAAGHIGGRLVAHVHGGDRAAGQVDDCLRHTVSKLAHVHFPATAASRRRLIRMGEDPWRVHLLGSPGIDGITAEAGESGRSPGSFALVLHHPVTADDDAERAIMKSVLDEARRAVGHAVVVYPNNDPGSDGIIAAIEERRRDVRFTIHRDLPRGEFLALMRDAAVMIGNSSSGIIEAASFGTPVLDVGPRQMGREHGSNVAHVAATATASAIRAALERLSVAGGFRRFPRRNIYGGHDTGKRIADALAALVIDPPLRRKLIAY